MARVAGRLLALLIAAMGLGYLFGGIKLVAVGGAIYYAIAGLLLIASAYALWTGKRAASWIYAALVIGSTAWTLWEVGLNAWAMLPRLGLLVAVGCLLLFVVRGTRALLAVIAIGAPAATLLAAILLGGYTKGIGADSSPSVTQFHDSVSAAASENEWREFAGTLAATRYSALSQIDQKNVDKLKVAWTYSFNEGVPNGLEVTPLKIGDSLYACSAANVIVSLDAETGSERWRFDPQVDLKNVPFAICRGVSYFRVPDATGACAERIFTNTVDARLIAVDAHTGLRCPGFGRNGEISLLEGMGEVTKGYYFASSAPTIGRGRIVIGGLVVDGQYWGEPSGVIRAFDAVTGALAWAYDVGRPDRTGAPEPGASYTPSTPNSWAPMSYDDELGLVYAPTGVATPDHYGVRRRPFDEEIGSAVVALDIETGRRRWVFQTVHHDVWDYDVASQPVLVDLQNGGTVRRALLQATKRGEVFSLDRTTGEPIDPVDERAVPLDAMAPGERLSPTQPFPRTMPSLDGGLLDEKMMWGLTPFDQMWCRIKFRDARYSGPMTPPGTTPSIMNPGYLGGMDWGGVSVDTQRGILIAVTNYVGNYLQLIPRAEADQMGVALFGANSAGGDLGNAMDIAIQANVPFAALKAPFLSPLTVPCQQPPWSRLTAIDLKSRRILWSQPLGSGKENGPRGFRSGIPLVMGVPAMGGSLVTAGNLTFVGASTDRTFRAFETTSGRVLWEADLPESGNAGPMTYLSPRGRQMVVIAAGGHKLLRGRNGDKIIAFALE